MFKNISHLLKLCAIGLVAEYLVANQVTGVRFSHRAFLEKKTRKEKLESKDSNITKAYKLKIAQNIFEVGEKENRVLRIVKAKYGLKNKN